MKLLYKRSALGIAWTLSTHCCIGGILLCLPRVLPVNIPSSFAFSGLLIWTWFQTALFQATGVIIANRPLIGSPVSRRLFCR